MGHARSILSLSNEVDQLRLRDEIIKHAWTVRATERTVEKRRGTPPPARHRSVELVALEEAIQRALVTRVRLVGSATKGRIEIAYSSTEELDRLAQAMGATT
jgi:ParB family chromosome partitioning protein